MSEKKITGRERERDAAEAWLEKNDPEYAKQKKSWQTPSTDALARDRSRHASLAEVKEINPGKHDGNYIRRPKGAGAFKSHKMENETAIDEELEF